MSDLRQLLARLAVFAVIAVSGTVRADDQDVIDYRRQIMKTMGEQAAIIGMIAQKKAPPGELSVHVQTLALAASTALKAFEPNVHGGKAKAEVWDKWADFSKRMNELVANTASLSKAAQGGIAAVAPKLQASLTCKSCHDIYREPLDK